MIQVFEMRDNFIYIKSCLSYLWTLLVTSLMKNSYIHTQPTMFRQSCSKISFHFVLQSKSSIHMAGINQISSKYVKVQWHEDFICQKSEILKTNLFHKISFSLYINSYFHYYINRRTRSNPIKLYNHCLWNIDQTVTNCWLRVDHYLKC